MKELGRVHYTYSDVVRDNSTNSEYFAHMMSVDNEEIEKCSRGGFGELKEIRGGSRELRETMSDPAGMPD